MATSTPVLAAVVTLLAWPLTLAAMRPGGGLTDSWIFAFQRTATGDPGFGSHMTYTYGPLGFLINPVDLVAGPFVLSCLFTVAVTFLAAALMVSTLRRRVPWWAAGLVAYLLAMAVTHARTPATAYFLDVFGLWLAMRVLRRDEGARTRRTWLLAGALSGFSLLVAPSVGLAVAGVLALAAAGRSGGWRPAVELGLPAALLTTLVLWVASGNALGQLVTSFRDQAQVSSGYTAAMSIEAAPRVTWFLGALAVAAALAVAWWASAGTGTRGRVAAMVAVALMVWLMAKEGFVRHDFHDLIFFETVPFLVAALWSGAVAGDRAVRLWRTPSIIGVMSTGALLVGATGASYFDPSAFAAPLRSIGPTVHVLASPGRSAQLRADGRRMTRATYGLPPAWLAQIGSSPVAVDPIEQAVGWAYPQLHEVAPPSVQEYVATTPTLDAHNAAFFESPHAPRFVLIDGESIDGRDPAFDAPAAQVALRCNYAELATSGLWTLLRRDPGRCSAPVPAGVVTTGYDQTVAVPRAASGTAVLARFSLQTPLWWRLADLVLKPTACRITFQQGGSGYRFVVATGDDLHLLSFPADTGSAAVPPATSLRIHLDGVGATSSGVQVRFSTVRVAGGG